MDRSSIAHFRTATGVVARRLADPSRDQGTARLIDDLKSRRRALGWSLADLAERSGIDAKSLDQWERRVSVPGLDGATRWAGVFGLHLLLAPAEKGTRQGLRIDWPARRVCVDGTPVRLTPMEWKALERLARMPGQVVSHRALYQHLYGEERDYRAQSTAIRVLITKLRRLLPVRIEAQWGKGYVLAGVASSLSEMNEGCGDAGDGVPIPGPDIATAPCERSGAAVPARGARAAAVAPAGEGLVALDEPKLPRVAPPPVRCASRRAEELGVIERFLAERGVTRCPDVAAIALSPLPTLVWDKVKRKWVRPSPNGREMI